MELIASKIVFWVLSLVILVFSVLTVTSRRILRAATYLLFVLIATAGMYLLLEYHFLAAVQITVYAGGVLVLYVFSILLTSHAGDKTEPVRKPKAVAGLLVSLAGIVLCLWIILRNGWTVSRLLIQDEIDMHYLGETLMGADKFQYILPFEALSMFLLACVVGGIMIARKR